MIRFVRGLLLGGVLIAALSGVGTASAAPAEGAVNPTTRCSVCGMFVAKYDNWLAQIRLADDKVLYFDGVKDLLVFFFDPGGYGQAGAKINEIWVKDYYSLRWVDGRAAFYAVGSDVYGPMGKEFVPFATREAAESFNRDHKGEKVLSFGEINDDLVQSQRAGAQMRQGGE